MEDTIGIESLESKDGKKIFKKHIHITNITQSITPNLK
jgi:hypothetical protein